MNPVTRRTFTTLPLLAATASLADIRAQGLTLKTKHLILVTSDGVRWQDVFGGMDPILKDGKSAGMADAKELREKLWKPTPEERRKALMPFFWGTLAPKGIVLGNVNKGSSVQVANRYRFSYPGYSEILTGRALDGQVKSNDDIQNPTPTFLEFVRRKWNLSPEQVALFASWETFQFIGEHTPGSIFINAGLRDPKMARVPERMREITRMQYDALTPWDSARHDAFTFEMALEYLKAVHPKLMYVAFDETDDWAHSHRYDRVLEMLGFVDRSLARLWNWVQGSREYRNNTTLVVTCDHGRGSTVKDWNDHGEKIPGDEQIWVAFIGPDTPAAGEAANTPLVHQQDIAPTILELLGIDYREYSGVEGKPIGMAIPKGG